METESQIQVCKKILTDELGVDEEIAMKTIHDVKQKIKEVKPGLSKSEFLDEFFGPEKNLLKDKILAYDHSGLSHEDQFRLGLYWGLQDVFVCTDEEKAKMFQKIEEVNPDLSDSEWFDEFFCFSLKNDEFDAAELSIFRKMLNFWMKCHQIEQKKN